MNSTPLINVLIADGDGAFSQQIKQAFHQAGSQYDVRMVRSLREYSEAVDIYPPGISIVDLNLPDGRAESVLHTPPESGAFPVLVMTSHGDEANAVAMLKAGALDYLLKTSEAINSMPHAVETALREWKLLLQRKRAEILLQTRVQLSEMGSTADVDETLQFALDKAELLTGSCIGFFHFVDPDQQHLTLQTWSTQTLRRYCTAQGKGQHYPVNKAGVWVDCLQTRQPVIHNDYASLPHRKGLPSGHVHIVRELVVPVIRGGMVVAIMGVGNKANDYGQDDVNMVSAVASMVVDLALRKKTQEEFEHFFQLVPDLVCIASVDGFFHKLNSEWEKVLGHTREELMAEPFLDWVHPDDRSSTMTKMQQLKEGMGLNQFVNRYRSKDGSYRWFEWHSTPMKEGNLIFAAARDITEQKESNEMLHFIAQQGWTSTQEDFFGLLARHLASTLGVAVVAIARLATPDTLHTVVLHVNGTPRNNIEYPLKNTPCQNVVGKTICHYPEKVQELYPDFPLLKDVSAESFIGMPLWSTSGQPIGIISLIDTKPMPDIRRITTLLTIASVRVAGELERNAAEETVRISKQKLSLHVENTPLGMVEWSPDFKVKEWNKAAETMFGYSKEEAIGRHANFLVPVSNRASTGNEMKGLLADHLPRRATNENLTRDGRTIICQWFNTPLVDKHGQVFGIASMVEDISERRQLEERVRRAQKLEAVGQLAGGVAHDYNNILGSFLMNLELLQQRHDLDDDVKESLDDMVADAKRAASLTRQLLLFGRRSVLEKKVLELNDVVSNHLKMLRRIIGEHVTLVFEPGNALPHIEADANTLEQVIMNLTLNARDAMPKGGTVRITTRSAYVDEQHVQTVPDSRSGRFACLSVSDTGTGMDEITLKKIFEPFFTTKEAGKGTGLGLSTVYGIVGQHKGWVEVKTRMGFGTTFHVYFPACEAVPSKDTNADTPALATGNETILLVEDEASLRNKVALCLAHLGYRVIQAGNGRDALSIWSREFPKIDLLFTDMVMPEGMTGMDLMEVLRSDSPQLKVIITSGYNEEMTQLNQTDGRLFRYLPKPFDVAQLSQVVRECLDHCKT